MGLAMHDDGPSFDYFAGWEEEEKQPLDPAVSMDLAQAFRAHGAPLGARRERDGRWDVEMCKPRADRLREALASRLRGRIHLKNVAYVPFGGVVHPLQAVLLPPAVCDDYMSM